MTLHFQVGDRCDLLLHGRLKLMLVVQLVDSVSGGSYGAAFAI